MALVEFHRLNYDRFTRRTAKARSIPHNDVLIEIAGGYLSGEIPPGSVPVAVTWLPNLACRGLRFFTVTGLGGAPDPATCYAPWRIRNIGNSEPLKLMQFIDLLEQGLGRAAMIDS